MFNREKYRSKYAGINFRQHPEKYDVGVGEQGVLLAQPYKGEILPYWKFKTPQDAEESSRKIYKLFQHYKKEKDFVGMDMARKFLQMGYTRSRRYANHSSGHKYDGPVPEDQKGISGAHGRKELPKDTDSEKAKSASIFYPVWQKSKNDAFYQKMLKEHKEKYQNKKP